MIMKVTINNEQTKNKTLYYEEGFWTGKRTIVYDGVPLTKVKRNLYELRQGDAVEQFVIKGNQLIGVTITMFGVEVEVARKLYWYEYVLAAIVFAPCVLFGAVGGAVGGALGFFNLVVIRNVDKIWLKIIISVQFAAISLLLSYILAVMILHAFTLVGL